MLHHLPSTLISTLALLASLTAAAPPGDSTDFLLRRPGQPSDAISLNTLSTLSFSPQLVTCVYNGLWGVPVWRVHVNFPPPPPDPFDSPFTPYDSSIAMTASEATAMSFRLTLLDACGKTTDGRDNVDEFQFEGRGDGGVGVRFRINYSRVLGDLCAKSCVEEALERMRGEGEPGVECVMPGSVVDRGPRWDSASLRDVARGERGE
jgi:hypothetical protein